MALRFRALAISMALLLVREASLFAYPSGGCIPDGETTQDRTLCCSRYVARGVSWCPSGNPVDCDQGTVAWVHYCGTRPVTDNACIPADGVDDILQRTHCCSGKNKGMVKCIDPNDFQNSWQTCIQICS